MKNPTLTATTPHGTFTRTTAKPYRFVAVTRHTIDRPGARPSLETHWSATHAGAVKLGKPFYNPQYPGGTYIITLLGVFPVDGTTTPTEEGK